MNAGMHVHHEAVEMGPAFLLDLRFLEEEIHQQGLAAADTAPDVKSFRGFSLASEQGKAALFFQQLRQCCELAGGFLLRRIGLEFPAGQRRAIKLHQAAPAMASARASRRCASSACSRSIMRPSRAMTPLPGFRAKASRMRLACAISSGEGAKMRLAASIWDGWIRVLPSKPKARPCAQAFAKPFSSPMSL